MNLIKEAGHVLATVAPTIATAIGGPFAGMAVSALQKALGLNPADSPAASQAAIEQTMLTATPEQILAIKQAENAFTIRLDELGITKQQLVLQDVANARDREIKVKDNTPKVLAYLTTAGFFTALIGTFLVDIPDGSKAIIFSMIGSLGTVWISQQGYYFGSSMGSSEKTNVLAGLASLVKK